MKKVLNYLIILFFVSIIVSCKKDNEYPKSLKRQVFVEGVFKMFTKNGEVTDQALIQDFVKRYRDSLSKHNLNTNHEIYSFDDDVKLFDQYNCEFVFFTDNNGEVIVKSDDAFNKSYKFNLRRHKDYINISLLDTITSLSTFSGTPIYKCTPEIIYEQYLPPATGFYMRTTYFRPIYAKEVNSEIHINIVSYLEVKHYQDEIKSINLRSAVNNIINPDYIENFKKLHEEWSDTLVYKESYITFK